jgi:hypothetical protein
MPDDTVRPAVAIEAWTSLVLGGLGVVGLALLGVAPLLAAPAGFPALPFYAFGLGGVLVVAAATMRLRALLIVLGCLALAAGLAASVAGHGGPDASRSALAIDCGAAVILGAAARRTWMAVPFLFAPLLVVAPGPGGGWAGSRDAFAKAWVAALGGHHLWAGLPAGLAVVGAFVGSVRRYPWVPVRPSAVPLLLLCAGLGFAGLVVGSLLPDPLAFARTVCLRAALLAGVLGWVALAYQAGRFALVWQAALACLLTLAGAVFVNAGNDIVIGRALAITALASLLPAVLAAVGLLVRLWVGTERPRVVVAAEPLAPRPVDGRSFFAAAPTPEAVLPTPLTRTGFGPPADKAQEPKEPRDEPQDPPQDESRDEPKET